MINKLCAPALLYVGFSLTQIIIDIFKKMYDIAFFKSIVMIVFTIILNMLCSQGLGVVSWLVVFLPFIMMTYITAVIMITLGFGSDTTETKNKVIYPSDYPKVLHKYRHPIINGNKDAENNTIYDNDNTVTDSKSVNNNSDDTEPVQPNGYEHPEPAM
jgi:hypothetical protein